MTNSRSEIELFYNRDMWNPATILTEKINLTLEPHSDLYFSELNPIFSFELDDIEKLNLFSTILLRDGLYFLLDFFNRFSYSSEIRTKILVSFEFASIVPKEWLPNIEFYKISSKNKEKREKLIFVPCISDGSEESIKRVSKELKDLRAANYKEVLCLPTLITDFNKERRNGDVLKVSNYLDAIRAFDCKLIEFNQIDQLDLTEFEIAFGKDQKIWCYDSFLLQKLLSKGGSEISLNRIDSTHLTNLSLYHDIHLVQKNQVYSEERSKKIWDFFKLNPICSKHEKLSKMEDSGFDDYLDEDLLAVAIDLMKEVSFFNSKG